MSDQTDLDARLAAVPMFAGLSKRQRGKLLDLSKVVTHHAGREIAAEGKGALAMHLVLDGAATVTIRGETIRALGPGDCFGEISLIDGKPRSASVTATDGGPLSTLAVPHHAFDQLLDDDPSAARAVLVTLCSRLREAEAG
jgi:CRP/FNR family cyclic AMP-dependent transcriptional regulator